MAIKYIEKEHEMMKKLIALGKILLIVVLVFTLASCSKENKVSAMDKIDDVDKSIDKVVIDEQNEKKQDAEEKAELIKKFTEMLDNIQNRKVMYGEFLDNDHYVYVVTDQLDEQKEKIMIVAINDNKVDMRFEGGDLDEDVQSISKINKIFINRLNDCGNPNICVFRKDEKYTKVQILEIDNNGKAIHYIGCCKKDNKTGEYIGDESHKYILDFSFESNYCNE